LQTLICRGIRQYQQHFVAAVSHLPALLVVGKKEAESHSVSVRRLGSDGQKVMPTDEAIAALVEEATPPDVKRARLET
jgi:threonyl-tRNA synthetase